MKRIGFLINPVAGIGGQAGMKGSDDRAGREDALRRGDQKTAARRAGQCLESFAKAIKQAGQNADVTFLAPEGEMGGGLLKESLFPFQTVGETCPGEATTREDTIRFAKTMKEEGADLLVFCGGDGTARDISQAVGSDFPVLGVPAGVKMYSACFAVNPWQAGELLAGFVRGRQMSFAHREVMDIDESQLSLREVSPSLYGFLKVLDDGAHLQRAKEMSLGDGEEAETLAEDILSEMREDTLYIIGPGGTTYRIKEKLHSKGTVRGVDLVKGGQILYRDADEQTIWRLLGQAEEAEIIVTCIGGNGFLFGRGNQQISPRIIRAVRKEHIRIAVTRQKLAHLGGKPMLVDTGDRETDEYLKGYYKIRFNGRESALYRVDRN